MSEHIVGIVNGFSSDLLIHSPSKSFVNRCETRLRLLLLFLVCSLFNFVSLKAHQGLIVGTYTAEFDYDVVGTLAAARYNETDILYNLPALSERPATVDDSEGRITYLTPEPQTELTTWLFDEGTFVPSAKIVDERRYSIIPER